MSARLLSRKGLNLPSFLRTNQVRLLSTSLVNKGASKPTRRNIDWNSLGFGYLQTNGHVEYTFADGKWNDGVFREDPTVNIHILSNVLHYGQCLFEGLKAFEDAQGRVSIFQPGGNSNAQRMKMGCERLNMAVISDEMFNEGMTRALMQNLDYMPPHSSGGSMYIRPFTFGCGAGLGLGPAPNYKFIVNVTPVGDYYKGGVEAVDALVIDEFDRCAPLGVGHIKAGGNYAADIVPAYKAKARGYPIALYLDAKEHNYVEEFSTSNFIALTNDGTFVTPKSNSVLRSITNLCIQQLAADMGLKVEVRPISWDEVKSFKEVAACGTAVVMTPIKSITRGKEAFKFGDGSTLMKLRQQLVDIQRGDAPDNHKWLMRI